MKKLFFALVAALSLGCATTASTPTVDKYAHLTIDNVQKSCQTHLAGAQHQDEGLPVQEGLEGGQSCHSCQRCEKNRNIASCCVSAFRLGSRHT